MQSTEAGESSLSKANYLRKFIRVGENLHVARVLSLRNCYTTPMGFLSTGPRICKEGERIIASTGYVTRLLSFGTMFREVTVDTKMKKVRIRNRKFWFWDSTRTVGFDKIKHVTYGYRDESLGAMFSWSHDTIDSFLVGLRFINDTEMHLFTFAGEGTFTNHGPLPDWLYWEEYATDLSGAQEVESRMFIDLLSEIIGVSVVPPRG